MSNVTIRDAEPSGKTVNEFTLKCSTETISIRELIRNRVHQEVLAYNATRSCTEFRGLVRPEATERRLNGERERQFEAIDWKAQFAKAVKAFEQGKILILASDRQVGSLDETIEIAAETSVTFLRMTLLAGG